MPALSPPDRAARKDEMTDDRETREARRARIAHMAGGLDPYDTRCLTLDVVEGLLRLEARLETLCAAVEATAVARAATPRKAKKG